jgi:hypothetical protein
MPPSFARRDRAAYGQLRRRALSFGFKAAWGQRQVARSIQSLNAQMKQSTTAADIAATRDHEFRGDPDASGPARRGNAKPALTTRTPATKGLKWLIPTIPHPPP